MNTEWIASTAKKSEEKNINKLVPVPVVEIYLLSLRIPTRFTLFIHRTLFFLYCEVYNISFIHWSEKLQRVCIVLPQQVSETQKIHSFIAFLLESCQVWNM